MVSRSWASPIFFLSTATLVLGGCTIAPGPLLSSGALGMASVATPSPVANAQAALPPVKATSHVRIAGNLEPMTPNGQDYSTPIKLYDADGNLIKASINFAHRSYVPSIWQVSLVPQDPAIFRIVGARWQASDSANPSLALGDLKFDQRGVLSGGSLLKREVVTIPLRTRAPKLAIEFDFGTAGNTAGVTQIGRLESNPSKSFFASTATMRDQDGYGPQSQQVFVAPVVSNVRASHYMKFQGNLEALTPIGGIAACSVELYDSMGIYHMGQVEFTKVSTGSWVVSFAPVNDDFDTDRPNWTGSQQSGRSLPIGMIQFASSGQLAGYNDSNARSIGSFDLFPKNGSEMLRVSPDFGEPDRQGAMTCEADPQTNPAKHFYSQTPNFMYQDGYNLAGAQ
jgi:hypothetical protein